MEGEKGEIVLFRNLKFQTTGEGWRAQRAFMVTRLRMMPTTALVFINNVFFLRGLVLGKLIGVKNVNSLISYQYRIVFKSSSSFLSLTIFYHS